MSYELFDIEKQLVNIRFDPATGAIKQMDSSPVPVSGDLDSIQIEIPPGESFPAHYISTRRVDVTTRTLIEVAPEVQRHEVDQAIFNELSNTDQYVISDRPMTRPKRAAWKAYRQALRDLSKLPSVTDMLAAWPMRPDGTDTAAHLKSRIA